MERDDVVATKVEEQLLIYACEGGRHLHPPNNYTAVDKVRGLIFDAPTLSRFETEKLAATLQQLRLKIGQSSLEPGHTEMKKTIFDKVRDVGEQALREIQSDLGHTGESLARSIEDVVSHWRLCLTLVVMAALGIVTTAICFYCEGARLMCCILARRVRRRKEERRKSKASVPRKGDIARAKTFEAASDKGHQDEAHNGEAYFSIVIRAVSKELYVVLDTREARARMSSQLPISILRAAQNYPMLVELKNGETYNGHLVSCDAWMNLHPKDVICTSRVFVGVLQFISAVPVSSVLIERFAMQTDLEHTTSREMRLKKVRQLYLFVLLRRRNLSVTLYWTFLNLQYGDHFLKMLEVYMRVPDNVVEQVKDEIKLAIKIKDYRLKKFDVNKTTNSAPDMRCEWGTQRERGAPRARRGGQQGRGRGK
uniref:Sm domain-containing protein n=1 Tax=Ascaris lumbricoides TaxID=6252 RepID=A0A9J2PQK7_ASCLU